MTNMNICRFRFFNNADRDKLKKAVGIFGSICDTAGMIIDTEDENHPCFAVSKKPEIVIEECHFAERRQDFYKYLYFLTVGEFDLGKNLLRYGIVDFDDNSAALIVVFFHLAADFYGSTVAMKKISQLYEKLISDETIDLSEKMPSYFDYLDSRDDYSKTKAYNRDISFFREYYNREYRLGSLYEKKNKSRRIKGFADFFAENSLFPVLMGEDEKKALSKVSDICSVSEAHVLSAVFELLCCAYMGEKRIGLSFFYNGRYGAEKEIVGDMVQSILILVEVDNSQTVKDFILSRFKDKMAVAKHLRVGRKITEAFSPRCSISINVVDLDDTRIKGINMDYMGGKKLKQVFLKIYTRQDRVVNTFINGCDDNLLDSVLSFAKISSDIGNVLKFIADNEANTGVLEVIDGYGRLK